jgi:hypothetical protein
MTTPRSPRQPIFIQLIDAGEVQQVVQLMESIGVGRAASQLIAQFARALQSCLSALQQSLNRYDCVVVGANRFDERHFFQRRQLRQAGVDHLAQCTP